ncbi:SRPBCC family protein [Nocardioides mangrovicus]|uniref:SRPBCC family protein n=1 Tax=Nocardioides mangrovicus TaxID=2478913 RepID=A0A3L8P093_9ACTN|nr:SRPBCC family protein [Nocardioides mangrovicus]RLV47788.1 SRPBCC family protein [Nocardioides mangrovicus]
MKGAAGGTVRFAVPRETAFDYLADPANRAQWQASLRRVEDVVGEVGNGQTWTDVTKPGLRPRMRTKAYEPYDFWAEHGEWRGVRAYLSLELLEHDGGCEVGFRFAIHLPYVPAALSVALTRASVPAVRADLRRAAQILAERSGR